MPLLSTIRLTLPLKLQQRAHVACSIKCMIDLADRSMIKCNKGNSILYIINYTRTIQRNRYVYRFFGPVFTSWNKFFRSKI